MIAVPADTGIDVGRSRAADAVLTTTLLFVVVALGLAARAQPRVPAVVLGGSLTVLAEVVAYRYRGRVQEAWRRQPVRVLSILLALAVITVGAVVAPDRSLSAFAGAFGTYLILLALVSSEVVDPFRE